MAWDWIAKGAKRVQELGTEYKQSIALVERLLTLAPAEAETEFARVWPGLDERARAGLAMTIAGLSLTQQGSSSKAPARTDGLKRLHTLIERANAGVAPAPSIPNSLPDAAMTAARMAHRVADMAERAKPKAAGMVESARRGIEQHGPAIESAVKVVLAEIITAKLGSTATGSPATASARPAAPRAASTVITPTRQTAAPAPTTATIAGEWAGTLSGPAGTLDVTYRFAKSGRPVFGYVEKGSGAHNDELTHEGQKIQYVPPGGGVVTVVVLRVKGSATESGFLIKYTFERADHGYLTQVYQQIALDCRLRGSEIDATYVESGNSYFGDRDGSTGGGERKEYAGRLRRVGV